LKEMLVYGLPLVPTSIAFWVLNSLSSYAINYYHSNTEVGLFQMATFVSSIVAMFSGAFQMAWGPFAFSIMKNENAKEVYSQVFTLYTLIMSTLALGVAIFSKEILIIFTSEPYYEAYKIAGFLAFNSILYSYVYIAVIGCNIAKDNKPLATSILVGSILTFLFMMILVPKYSMIGAAIATIVGYSSVPIYVFYKSQKYFYVPFKFGLNVLILALAFATFLISLNFTSKGLDFFTIIYKSLTLISFTLLVGLILWYSQSFKNLIKLS
jgi:O-antigen/teichoic acid export membrane protein